MSEQRERAISFDVQRVLPVLTLIPGWPWSLADINEEGGLGGFLIALRRLIEARGGIAETSKKTGLPRQSIYRALSERGNPTVTTLAQQGCTLL